MKDVKSAFDSPTHRLLLRLFVTVRWPSPANYVRRQAAVERAACERAERVAESLQKLEQLQKQKEQRQKGTGDKTRCSTTNPEARNTGQSPS